MKAPRYTEEEVDAISSEVRVELEVLKEKVSNELTRLVRGFRDNHIRRLLVENPTWDADFVREVARELLPHCLGDVFDHKAPWALVLVGSETH